MFYSSRHRDVTNSTTITTPFTNLLVDTSDLLSKKYDFSPKSQIQGLSVVSKTSLSVVSEKYG